MTDNINDSDSDSKSSNSNEKDILDKIIEILQNVEKEEKTLRDEIKKVKSEVDKQIKEQQNNFIHLLEDFENKTNEKINESIKEMKENIIQNIKDSQYSKEKKYKVKIDSKYNNLELKKSLLENKKIKFTIENIGNTTIPSGFYLKNMNSNDDNIELNHEIKEDLEPNKKMSIKTNFTVKSLSDSSSTVYDTDLFIFHDKIKKIIQEPFHFTINFLEEDDDNDCPFTEEDYNYFDEKVNEIYPCEKKKIKKTLLSFYKRNKEKIKDGYKTNKEELFQELIQNILSILIE